MMLAWVSISGIVSGHMVFKTEVRLKQASHKIFFFFFLNQGNLPKKVL